MSTKDINITNVNILLLRQQRNTLLEVAEMFDTGIINAGSYDSYDEGKCETAKGNVVGLINMIDDMLDIAEDCKPV